MSYDTNLADRVRECLAEIPSIDVEEKEMFNVLNFMVNGKTCVCVSNENLMLRFDPIRQEELSEKYGYQSMLMKGKEYKGYCYINPVGFKNRKDFEFFLNLCLDYNKVARSSKKRKM
ncbi:MAG: TfoX/Sxy family protein [Cytophagales bacterium]